MAKENEKRFPHEPLNNIIDRTGWLVTGVPSAAVYSVGLIDMHDHPELVINGLDVNSAYAIIANAQKMMSDGTKFEVGGTYKILELPVKISAVDPSNFHDWFCMAQQYHGSELRMLQILWPDRNGRFPDDPLFDSTLVQKVFDTRHDDYTKAADDCDGSCECGICKGQA